MKVLIMFMMALAAEVWIPQPPPGLDLYLPTPATNPLTREKVAKGRRLFFDKRLSRDGTVACVSCHDPKRAFTDGRAVALGIAGAEGIRNPPAIIMQEQRHGVENPGVYRAARESGSTFCRPESAGLSADTKPWFGRT